MGVSHSLLKQPYNTIAYRILVALLWTQFTVLSFAKAVFERLPFIGELSTIFIPVCIILATMAAMPWFLKRVKSVDIIFYLGYVFVVLLTMALFRESREFLTEEWWSILISAVPFYFIGVSFSFRACSRDLFWCSVVGIVCVFVYRLYQLNNGVVLETDDMYTAYNMLPSVMYLVYYASYKKRKIYWGVAAIGVAILFIFGTRGPVLCMIGYLGALAIKRIANMRSYKKIFGIIFVLAIVIFVFVYEDLFMNVLSVMAKIFERIGFSTRVLDFFLSGDIVTSKGREFLAKQTIEAIVANPILGYGITGDRYLFGIYPHNFILEIWCHFGVIIGTLILLVLLILTLLAFMKTRGNDKVFKLVLMLAVMVYGKLLISNSYTIEPYFYFMIGVYISIMRKPFYIKKAGI